MGWSFACDTCHDRKAQVADFKSDRFFSSGWKLIDSRVVGNHFWGLLQNGDKKSIWLGLMQGGGKTMGWGYKGLGEECGPYYFDCPLPLLNQATETTNERALEWRQSVRTFHATKRPKVKSGDVVESGAYKYRLVEPAGPRRGWRVQSLADGCIYRMPANQLARAKLV